MIEGLENLPVAKILFVLYLLWPQFFKAFAFDIQKLSFWEKLKNYFLSEFCLFSSLKSENFKAKS